MSAVINTQKRHIYLYAEDFDYDVWSEYCDICGVPSSATEIKIVFDDDDVSYEDSDTERGEDDEA